MLKKLLIAIGVIAVVIFVAAAVLVAVAPTDFAVERVIVINRPQAEVFDYVRKVRNQNEWATWFRKEPTMHQEFVGNDGEVGFVSRWKGQSEEVGEGEQEITRIVDGSRVDTELRFKTPFESKADAYLITEPIDPNTTRVKWGFTSSVPRPFNAMFFFMNIDAAVGKDYQEGLNNLKQILERRGGSGQA